MKKKLIMIIGLALTFCGLALFNEWASSDVVEFNPPPAQIPKQNPNVLIKLPSLKTNELPVSIVEVHPANSKDESDFLEKFKVAFKQSELARSKLMFNSSTADLAIVGFLLKRPTQAEIDLLLKNAKILAADMPPSKEKLVESAAAEFIRRKLDRFEGHGDQIGVIFEIPTDTTRVPYVTTWSPKGESEFNSLLNGETPMYEKSSRVVYDEESYVEILETKIAK